MTTTTKAETASNEATPPQKKTIARSGKPFPYADLERAQVIAERVKKIGVDACKRGQVAASLDIDADGGGFRSKVGAASKFGLVSARSGMLILTDLGKRVLDPQTQENGLVESFLSVPVFDELYQKLENVPNPDAEAVEQQLADLGVIKSQVTRARQVFMKSAKYAGFYKLHPDRLMQPGQGTAGSPNGEQSTSDTHSDDTYDRGKTNGPTAEPADQGSGQPLLEALFATRPKSEDTWTLSEWTDWLEALMPVLRMDYKGHTALRQIKVAITSKEANADTAAKEGAP